MNAVETLRQRRLLLRVGAASAVAALSNWSCPVWAQDGYPSRAVRLIVPNAPGSSVDTIGRVTASQLAIALRQPMVVDNRAGAAGAIGVESTRQAMPDGYTMLIASSSAISVAPLLQKAVTYDPLRDFDFVSLIALLPNVLVCNTALAVNTTSDLIAYAKSRPGKTNMASAGIGSVSHLAGVAFQEASGFESLHVPYKGGSQGVASVVSGETDWVLTPAPAALGLVSSGRLRLLGHSMARSAHPLGGVPAIAETVPGFEFASWIGMMTPRSTPPQVIDAMHAGIVTALQQAGLRQAFEANGAVPTPSTPEAFRGYLVHDIELNRKAVRAAKLEPE